MSKKIVIGSDHGGFKLKNELVNYLKSKSYFVQDVGTYSTDSCHYPDYAHQVAKKVSEDDNYVGILICTTGQGMVITANKHYGIRAALCWDKEIARLARGHNNANVICLPANFISAETVKNVIDAFLSSKFESGRHLQRIEMMEVD